ncbi:hypothetical protein [Beggiatoa leptomitoformis]|uniref:Uncharacterized protein n=1 Tax=Beggiatoa leptomitoformis TaxID=288004 RepID=A0A2N9YHA7_9GAMM|nr:hypothetical protein [Beggiatoa leptomitoformis]ALG67875.1 hypothetical protein AL038_09330 [Beggiatoa leptomitoformis]AUI69864.1 hypothetical protein BLE401_14970 [Beggiatoa leptomitoformis]
MIQNWDSVIAACNAQQVLNFYAPSTTTKGAGTFFNYWGTTWTYGAGVTPSTGAGQTFNKDSVGAIRFTAPPSGEKLYLGKWFMSSSVASSFFLYDFLWGNSGLVGNSLTLQAINSVALPTRASNGEGVQLWVNFYQGTDNAAPSITIKYTNSEGVANRTATATIPATNPVVGQAFPVLLQAGDKGVQSIQSFQMATVTPSAGDIGLMLVKQVSEMSLQQANVAESRDPIALLLPQIDENAAISIMQMCTTTVSGIQQGTFRLLAG